MDNLDKDILMRSHQPQAPLKMYDDRCITILTNSLYKDRMNIAKVSREDPDNVKIEKL